MQAANDYATRERRAAAEYQSSMPLVSRTLGENLRALRTRLGLTQMQASALTGVAQSTYSTWERGKVFAQIDAIEEAVLRMGGDPAELLTGHGDPRTDHAARLLAEADPDTRDIVLNILVMRAAKHGRAVS